MNTPRRDFAKVYFESQVSFSDFRKKGRKSEMRLRETFKYNCSNTMPSSKLCLNSCIKSNYSLGVFFVRYSTPYIQESPVSSCPSANIMYLIPED